MYRNIFLNILHTSNRTKIEFCQRSTCYDRARDSDWQWFRDSSSCNKARAKYRKLPMKQPYIILSFDTIRYECQIQIELTVVIFHRHNLLIVASAIFVYVEVLADWSDSSLLACSGSKNSWMKTHPVYPGILFKLSEARTLKLFKIGIWMLIVIFLGSFFYLLYTCVERDTI